MIILNYQITKKSHKCTFWVSRKYRTRGAVFKVRGHLFEVGWGWGGGGQIQAGLSLWLFRTARYTGPFLTESLLSGVMFINFTPLKSTFLLLRLIAPAGSTSRSLQTVGSCNPFILSRVIKMRQKPHHQPDIIGFKKPQSAWSSIQNFHQKGFYSASLQMLHSLAGLKTQKSRTKCSFVKISVLRLTTHQNDGIEKDQ